MKKLVTLTILVQLLTSAFGQDFKPAFESTILPAPAIHSLDELKAEIANAAKVEGIKVYKVDPVLKSPYAPGELNADYIDMTVKTVNLFRFIAGLNNNIIADPKWNTTAQYGAALLAIRDKGLSHTPDFPSGIGMPRDFYDKGYVGTSSSNLDIGAPDAATSIFDYMDDSDNTNIDRLGHRRWVLSPSLSQVGVGQAKNYFSLKVFGEGSKPSPDLAYVAWPPVGFIPLSHFGHDQAWNLSINPNAFEGGLANTDKDIKVKLTRLRDKKVFNLTWGSKNGYFNIERSGFGIPFAIIFRPDNLVALLDHDRFSIEISGVKTKAGKPVPISYQTEFFSTGPEIKALVKSKNPKSFTIYASSTSDGFELTDANIAGTQATMGYVGPKLQSFTFYVDSSEGILPIGIEINHDGVIHMPGETIKVPKGGLKAYRIVSPMGGIMYTTYTKAQGWGAWVKTGSWAEFANGEALETISIVVK